MGAYEQFFLKDETLSVDQVTALMACGVSVTNIEEVFKQRCEDDRATILIVKRANVTPSIWIKESYITATNVAWKEEFRKMLRKNKIHYKSKTIFTIRAKHCK